MKPVIVIWKDAHSDCEGWADPNDTDDGPYLIRTAGFQLEPGQGKKKGHVSIAQSISADNMIDSVLHIPKRMVVSVSPLELQGAHDGKASDESRSIRGPQVPKDRQTPRL
jgi:hypothetical protein